MEVAKKVVEYILNVATEDRDMEHGSIWEDL